MPTSGRAAGSCYPELFARTALHCMHMRVRAAWCLSIISLSDVSSCGAYRLDLQCQQHQHQNHHSGMQPCLATVAAGDLHLPELQHQECTYVCSVVICGAGIIGSAIAYYLAMKGIAATVVERASVACASSGK